MSDIILGIHSNVASDDAGYTAGHAWLSITRAGRTTTYGLWPDDHPRTIDNGDGSDIRVGMSASSRPAASRFYKLSDAQARLFDTLVAANVEWRYTNTCASWASEVVDRLLDEDVDADDYGGFETPRELGQSILDLERTSPTSRISPRPVQRNPASSALTRPGS